MAKSKSEKVETTVQGEGIDPMAAGQHLVNPSNDPSETHYEKKPDNGEGGKVNDVKVTDPDFEKNSDGEPSNAKLNAPGAGVVPAEGASTEKSEDEEKVEGSDSSDVDAADDEKSKMGDPRTTPANGSNVTPPADAKDGK